MSQRPLHCAAIIGIGIGALSAASIGLFYIIKRERKKAKHDQPKTKYVPRVENKNINLTSKKNRHKKSQKEESKNKVTLEELLVIFHDLKVGMQNEISTLMEVESQLRNDPKKLSDEEIRQFLQQHYAEALPTIEEQIYKKHNVKREEIQIAHDQYQHEPEFQREIETIKRLDENLFMPPIDPQKIDDIVPSWLSIEKLLDILTELMEGTSIAMEQSIAEVVSSMGISISSEEVLPPDKQTELERKITVSWNEKITTNRTRIFEKYSINQEVFTYAMAKYGDNVKLKTQIEKLTQDQAERYSQLGMGFKGIDSPDKS